jgi:hypothetical protein
MKTLKTTSFIATLVLLLLSCNRKPQEQKNEILENTNRIGSKEWIKKVQMLQQMKEGDTLVIIHDEIFNKTTEPQRDLIKPRKNKKTKIKEPTLEEFEYSNHWRKEAYKASLKYITDGINKKPNCKVIRQGYYNPNSIRYIGNFGFLTKVYCEFDCNQGYNNPSYYWIEVYYHGNNSWRGELIKQKFAD